MDFNAKPFKSSRILYIYYVWFNRAKEIESAEYLALVNGVRMNETRFGCAGQNNVRTCLVWGILVNIHDTIQVHDCSQCKRMGQFQKSIMLS